MQVIGHTGAWTPLMALVTALVMSACADGRSDEAAERDQVMAGQESDRMMSGTDNMQGMGSGGSMDQMEAHLRLMDGATADSMQALMTTHRQMVTNAIAEMNATMRGVATAIDTASSTATIDSLRQDLDRMQQMSADELQQFMPAHSARVRQLMESHRARMGPM